MSQTADLYSRYVPDALLLQFDKQPETVERPWIKASAAAALFADISGFTALAEKFAERGTEGVEELSFVLNAYAGEIIDIIRQQGGDIARFAGDGLLALWPVEEGEDPQRSARQAAACGRKIQQEMRDFPASSDVRLSLRIGIGAGAANMAVIEGEPGRWEFLVVGPAITQCCAAQQQAAPGEVRLSPEAASLEREPAPAPVAAARPPVADSEALAPYLPQPVAARLAAGQTAWLAEMRLTSIVFVRLRDLDINADFERAQTVFRALHESIRQFDGTVIRIAYDDKGLTALAAFGLPSRAHEDDAVRAVNAAATLQARLRAQDQATSAGIATGRVFCGAVGSAQRCEYTLIGGAVNRAARLMQAVDQDLVCDGATRTAGDASYVFEPLPPLSMKGSPEPVSVFRARRRTEQRPLPVFDTVGRQAERQTLARHLDDLSQQARGSIVIIEGEAGIGKSHLVAELAVQASALGITALAGAGTAMDQSTLYHAWHPVFTHLFDLETLPENPAGRLARLLSQIPSDQAAFAPLLSGVLAIELPDSEITRGLGGRERAEATRDFLADLLRQRSEAAPILLILEDAHWFDSASWALLRRVIAHVPRLMAVLTTRGAGFANEDVADLLGAPHSAHLVLSPLSPSDALELARQRLGARILAEPVARFIQSRAEGNPFFCQELVYALRDRDALVVRDGLCEFTAGGADLQTMTLLDTVQGVVMSRIDRLSPPQQLILKVASVIGRVFAFRALRAVYPVAGDVSGMPGDLEVLARLELTPLDSVEPELRYLFKHVITQEVAYHLMLLTQRRQIHEAVARWHESAFAEDLAPVYGLLAYHWGRACELARAEPDVLDKALAYSRLAGAQAMQNHALLEAISHLSQALELLQKLPAGGDRDRTELELQAFVAIPLTLTRGWAAPEVGRAYHRAYELGLQVEEKAPLFPILTGIYTYYLVSGQLAQAREISLQNWELAQDANDPDMILEAEHDRGTVSFYLGDLNDCLTHSERVRERFDPHAHRHHLMLYGKNPGATALCHAGIANWGLGYPDRALEIARAGVRAAEELVHPFSHAWALAGVAVIHQMRGDILPFQETGAAMMALGDRYGFPNWLAQGLAYVGWSQIQGGETQAGLEKMRQGIGLWHRTGAELVRPYLLALFADGLNQSGFSGEAADVLEQAFALVEQTGERWWEPAMLCQRGGFHLGAGHPDRAESDFRQAQTLAQAKGMKSAELRAATALARRLAGGGHPDQAYALLAPLYRWFREGLDTKDLREARAVIELSSAETGG